MGHPSYKFYDDWNTYEERCKAEDPVGAKLVFPDEEAEILDLDDYQSKLEELQDNPFCPEKKGDESGCFDIELEANEKAENDEEEYVKKDVIRKFQYDYGGTTCMTNKFPESDSNSTLRFAPAEGKTRLRSKVFNLEKTLVLTCFGKGSDFNLRGSKVNL